jgi:hypothetical protein
MVTKGADEATAFDLAQRQSMLARRRAEPATQADASSWYVAARTYKEARPWYFIRVILTAEYRPGKKTG